MPLRIAAGLGYFQEFIHEKNIHFVSACCHAKQLVSVELREKLVRESRLNKALIFIRYNSLFSIFTGLLNHVLGIVQSR